MAIAQLNTKTAVQGLIQSHTRHVICNQIRFLPKPEYITEAAYLLAEDHTCEDFVVDVSVAAPSDCQLQIVRGEVKHLRPSLDTLEEFVDLLVCHLLAELGEHVSQLASTDEAIAFLIEDLEATNEFLYTNKD